MKPPSATPFTIQIPDDRIKSIKSRLADISWPRLGANDWRSGPPQSAVRNLADYWAHRYDWNREQQLLNAMPQFRAEIGGGALHFVHKKSQNSTKPPVVLLHGWPSSFYEFYRVAEHIASGAGDAGAARDVVIVSLPGFAFSEFPSPIGPKAVAALVDRLMSEVLGYPRYFAHGGDWGAIVATWLGLQYPERCSGIHLSMISARIVGAHVSTTEEQDWLNGFRARFEEDGAYFRLQSSRPQTIGYALDDSPIGTAAWMLEKFAAWSDIPSNAEGPDLWSAYSRDQLLTNIMLYVATGTAGSAAWIYRAFAEEGPPNLSKGVRVTVPVGVIALTDPAFPTPPQPLVDKAYNVVHWGKPGKGGHFPGFEIPDALSQDILAFMSNRH